MKILFDHSSPFALAHGGFQIQIEQTRSGLQQIGVDVEPLQWWNGSQHAEVIHYFGRPSSGYIEQAHQKGMKVVMSDLLTGTGSRSAVERSAQKAAMQLARKLLPSTYLNRLAWDSYKLADACIANTTWEAGIMERMFDAPPAQIHVVPNGVEEVFLNSTPRQRDKWLVCTATITERKRVSELAAAAVEAQTPLWIVGRPYSESDPYFRKFSDLFRANSQIIRYEGAIEDRARMAQVYLEARGFVLLSTMETLSLSSFEAAACRCPLLLSDLPWARSVFNESASYCPIARPAKTTARFLRKFYDEAETLPPPPPPKSWIEVARLFKAVYESVLLPARISS
jgi:glycosyltransferase involved in cell wall biosynthesis